MFPMKLSRLFCLIQVAVLMLSSVPVLAAAVERVDRSGLPITVKSNEMTADNNARTAVFSGKVVAKQGDVTIFSDRLVVKYSENNSDVDRIEASGTVRIIQLDRTGFSDHAIYESRTGRIVLTGSPRVVQGIDSVSGKIITYHIDDEKSEVSSDGDPKARVEAVINPRSRKKNDAATR